MKAVRLITSAVTFSRKHLLQPACIRPASSFSRQTKNRNRELSYPQLKTMADPAIEDLLQPLRQLVMEQGDLVRKMKADKAPEIDVKNAITELKARRKALEDKELALTPKEEQFDRVKLEDLLKQRFFYDMSFSIYGGITGLYDFGPMGCAMKQNLLQSWRKFFVLEEQMLEVDTAMITPEPVLIASGHVERFQDYMVKDMKSGECFRVDHLIEATFESMIAKKDTPESVKEELRSLLPKVDNMDLAALTETLRKYDMKSPSTGSELSDPVHFNLMFSTSIGPAGNIKGYLRPETAQGIFVNFKRLLEFKQGKLPFAAAQIGNAFRNEISPRSGLLRVREFTMAEIEHFCNPKEKDHPKFVNVKDLKLRLFSACSQMDGKAAEEVAIGDAVASKLVANETLGYFMARIYMFLVKVGVDPARLRFRQHMSNEMAHYACDCWDAEIKTSYGWVECVGCADRSCYDLTNHAKHTGARLSATKALTEPKIIDVLECQPQKGPVGKAFKKDAKVVSDYLSQLAELDVVALEQALKDGGETEIDVSGQKFVIKPDMVQVKRYQKKVHVEEIVPSVIEPSFGIGRIMYSIFEHRFRKREGDEQRTYLSLPPVIAPYKVSILPLSNNPQFTPLVNQLCTAMTEFDVSHTLDDSSGTIGRRYARTDQIAVPFGITVDFDSLTEPHTATLREIDSMKQVRAPLDVLPKVVSDLSKGRMSWEDVMNTYPVFETQDASAK